MVLVPGDPEAARAAGRLVGRAAVAVHAQGTGAGTARSQLDPAAFAGPAGDRVRAFLEQLHRANAAAATAMDRVASAIPRVAQAIEEAQKDETVMGKAKARLGEARRVYDAAALAVTRATGDVTAAAAGVISAYRAQALDPLHASGVAASAEQRLRDAERRLGQAQHQARIDQHLMDEAQRDYQRARHTFQQADDGRRRELRRFAGLCAAEEAATTACALPTVPEPGMLSASADNALGLVNTLLTLESIPAAVRTPIRVAVTSVDGPDGIPAGDDFPSLLGAAGDYATSVDPSAPLTSKVLAWGNELGLVMSPFVPGGGALAAVTGAAQTGQAMAEADPCNAPVVPPPAGPPPPQTGPPPAQHPVPTVDKVLSTGARVAGAVATGVATGTAAVAGALKSGAGDVISGVGEAAPSVLETLEALG